MSKFGISYNVFDGVELLEDSINHIKKHVDFISIVYQKKSYWGEVISDHDLEILKNLKELGLVDSIVEFNLNPNHAIHVNQINKRNLGKDLSKEFGCTHHMTLDCDEFYTDEQFSYLINWHKENPEKISYCTLRAYYKDTKYMISNKGYMDNDLYVSCFFPVEYEFVMNYPTSMKVDPTRKVGCGNNQLIYHHDYEKIIMHHLSYVRKDIYKKINNAAAKLRYQKNQSRFEFFTDCYDNFEEDGIAICADGSEYNIEKIDPIIELDKYYSYLK